jgi:uncharacterized membrane protein YhaH (DUF805 family)
MVDNKLFGIMDRGQYLIFQLISLFCLLIGLLIGMASQEYNIVAGIIIQLVVIVGIYIFIGSSVARLHARNHSGWWVLALGVPYIGLLGNIYLFAAKTISK